MGNIYIYGTILQIYLTFCHQMTFKLFLKMKFQELSNLNNRPTLYLITACKFKVQILWSKTSFRKMVLNIKRLQVFHIVDL